MTSGPVRNLPVLVFGEALVDAFADHEVAGGAPFNVACHLAGLGGAARLLSRVGDDPAALHLQRTATAFGVDWSAVQVDPEAGTGRVQVHETPAGHRFEILADQAYDRIDGAVAVAAVADMPPASWLYHGSLALRAASHDALLQLLSARRWRRFVDLNWRDAGPPPERALAAMRGADVLKLSDEELGRVGDWLGLPVPLVEALPRDGERDARVDALMSALDVEALLVTYGARGAAYWQPGGLCAARAEPVPTRVVDTVGAGDAFSARMLAGLAGGARPDEALPHAVAFAAAVCTLRGATPDATDFHARWRLAPAP